MPDGSNENAFLLSDLREANGSFCWKLPFAARPRTTHVGQKPPPTLPNNAYRFRPPKNVQAENVIAVPTA